MSENFNSMYWIRKRGEREELSQALRAADRREKRRVQQAARRAKKRAEKQQVETR